jgi:hypothetical protein
MQSNQGAAPIDIGIAVLAYSRPDHVQQVFDALQRFEVSRFSVFMDGADDRTIREKQAVIAEKIAEISWANVQFVRRAVNMGLRRSIVSAVSEMLHHHDAVIVLEDDCLPQAGFFEYMRDALSKYRSNPAIRSLCGYQFPHVASDSAAITGVCVSRFVPWGWATWRDRWIEYDTDLRHLLTLTHETRTYSSLPEDVRHYIDSHAALDDANDIWSINWVLTHYLTKTYCLFPSRPLVANIGFDGTGVHCFETNAFDATADEPVSAYWLHLPDEPALDCIVDRRIVDYMESHWGKTMLASNADTEPVRGVSISDVGRLTRSLLESAPILDLHTHLFPPQHRAFHLSGLDDLLTYHYLTVECLTVSGVAPSAFFSLDKIERAELVWDTLFRTRTPVSEAAKGIVTVLSFLGVEPGPLPYADIKRAIASRHLNDDQLFDKLSIKRVVMTNDPCNPAEWALFERSDWNRDRYRAAIRLDTLLLHPAAAMSRLAELGYPTHGNAIDIKALQGLLDRWAEVSSAEYVALSVDGAQLQSLLEDPLFAEGLAPWLAKNRMPLALMVGVKRQVNPDYGLGGDGLGTAGLPEIESLARTYPALQILITHLHHNAQQAVTVLARKLPNLKLFGFWWFSNQPSLIQQTLRMRLDLLGFGFVPQHSDARVLEQLIFKWEHFKDQLHDALVERYRALIRSGWPITEDSIRRDIGTLLHDNPASLLRSAQGGQA